VQKQKMKDYPAIAAVDLGSNSFHLLVVREVEAKFQVLHKEKQKIRLAAGLDSKNRLNQEAIDRAITTLKQFAETLKNFKADQVKVVATYTLRTATNIDYVLEKAAEVFPYPIEVISGQEEARLIYQGVAHNVHHDDKRLIIDIGGGSTEIIIGKSFTPSRLTSRNMGSASFSKCFFSDGKCTSSAFKRAMIRAEQTMEAIASNFIKSGWQCCLGTSGTIKNICAIVSIKFESDIISYQQLTWLRDEFIKAGDIDAMNIPGLQEDRKASICGGLAILLAIFEQFKIDAISYCDFALREGLMHEMQDNLKLKDIRVTTINSFSKRFDIDTTHANLIQNTARLLYQQLKKTWALKNSEHLTVLLWAVQLHEVGLSINSSSIHKHSAYIVRNSLLPGFTQQQQILLACLIRLHRKKIRRDELPELALISPQKLSYLLVIIRLSVLLNQKRQPDYLPNYELVATPQSLLIRFPQAWFKGQALLQADLEVERQYLKKLGIELNY
jgi:exopolyphosphatase/guanosine-5'-triphosphate,3'-diphosphate pyrophosphatase